MKTPIYLDYAATTPMDQLVVEVMLPFFTETYGNAGSGTHPFGWKAKFAVEEARKKVAKEIGAEPDEIIFTSGATESINLAIKGVYENYSPYGKHIISCKTEHKAVLDTLSFLESKGADITYLDVDKNGNLSLEELEKTIRKDTILLAFMWVNNETGLIHPIEKIGKIAQKHQVVFLSDATQALGKLAIDVKKNNVGLLPISAHKIYGPKGIGALYVSKKNPRVSLAPLIHGGGQEQQLRAGTLNVPGIVGLGKAIELLGNKQEQEKIRELKKLLVEISTEKGAKINGADGSTVDHIISVQWPGINAAELIKKLPLLAFSLGSACVSENPEPSHVLSAMHLNPTEIKSSFRLSIGRNTTTNEILEIRKLLSFADSKNGNSKIH